MQFCCVEKVCRIRELLTETPMQKVEIVSIEISCFESHISENKLIGTLKFFRFQTQEIDVMNCVESYCPTQNW